MPGKVVTVEILADQGQSKQTMQAFTVQKDFEEFLTSLIEKQQGKIVLSDNTQVAVFVTDSPLPGETL